MRSNPFAPALRAGRIPAALMVAAAFSLGSISVAMPASAAEVPDAVTNITVTNEQATTPIRIYQTLRVTADWAVPDNTAPGTTFSLGLPAELRGLTTTFPLTDADGAVFGDCTVESTVVLCTLSDLVTTRPLDVHGTLFFSGRFTDEAVAGQTNPLNFDTGTQVATVPVDIAAGVPFDGNGFRKDGTVRSDGSVDWYINLPAPVGGTQTALTNVVVTDDLNPALRFTEPASIVLRRGTGLNADGSGPAYNETVDATSYSVVVDGQRATITIPFLPAGAYYAIFVKTVVVDPAGPLENSATLSAQELTGLEASTANVDFASGGDASGTVPDAGVSPVTDTPATPGTSGAVSGVGSGTSGGATLARTGTSDEVTGALTAAGVLSLLLGALLLSGSLRSSRRTQR